MKVGSKTGSEATTLPLKRLQEPNPTISKHVGRRRIPFNLNSDRNTRPTPRNVPPPPQSHPILVKQKNNSRTFWSHYLLLDRDRWAHALSEVWGVWLHVHASRACAARSQASFSPPWLLKGLYQARGMEKERKRPFKLNVARYPTE